MIRELRRRHLGAVALLAVAVPGTFIAAIAARRPPIRSNALAPALTGVPVDLGPAVRRSMLGSPPLTISLTLITDTAATGPDLLLRAEGSSLPPDLLAYWSPAAPADSTLPPNSDLLGALDGESTVALSLPPGARNGAGVLLVYSAVDHRIVASGSLPGAVNPADQP